MKKLISGLLLISVLLGMNSCVSGGDLGQDSVNASDTSRIVCDVNKYANISSKELVELLGNPDNISDTTPATGFVEIPCTYYDYYDTEELGEVSFLLINDTVVKFTAYNDFPLYSQNKILSSLNVSKSKDCVMAVDTKTAIRFRCLTDSIDDLWITNIDEDTYGFLAVTYDMMYFEEWYLPMTISEQSDYQYWTQEYVKSILKSPKSADFPNIGNWAIVKNNFYVAAQSYVDAINSFGAEIRSNFTFVYPAGSSTPIYAVFDDEIIIDNGYVSTANLVKQLVEEITKQESFEPETQEIMVESSTSIESTISEPETSALTPIPTPETTTETTVETFPATVTENIPETIPPTTPETEAVAEIVPETVPVGIETTQPIQETNSISDLEYIVYNVCKEYNSGDTPYDGQLYGTVNSATSVTIEHYVRDLVPVSEEYKLYQMEDALLSVFADTLSAVFPESIEISIYTTATIIEDFNTTLNDENTDLDGVVTDIVMETAPIVVEWISAEQLKNDYNLNYWWNGEEIQLYNDSEKFIIYGSPKSSFEHDQIYNGSCNGITVRFKYSSVTNYNSGNIFFYYDDLISAGII